MNNRTLFEISILFIALVLLSSSMITTDMQAAIMSLISLLLTTWLLLRSTQKNRLIKILSAALSLIALLRILAIPFFA